MNKKINTIKLYIKKSSYAKGIADELKKKLIKNGFKIDNKHYDLAVSIGGDGTFLKMIHENKFNDSIYYMGINAGALGFLTDIEVDYIDNFINKLKKNNYTLNDAYLLNTIVTTKTNTKEYLSINELVIKKNNNELLKSDVYIDNELLENYIGDGLLISSANGSTAYNLAFNGSIMDNKLKAFIMTPMAPINNNKFNSLTNSLILSEKRNLTIKQNNIENICLINDGILLNINAVDKITIKLSNKKIKFLSVNNIFAKKINSKIIG